ncbi:hypothetical protein V8B97DRAFT_1919923 [Scleroderma yunnanense]
MSSMCTPVPHVFCVHTHIFIQVCSHSMIAPTAGILHTPTFMHAPTWHDLHPSTDIETAYGKPGKIRVLSKMRSLIQHRIRSSSNPVDEANKLIECADCLKAAGFPLDEKILTMIILIALP